MILWPVWWLLLVLQSWVWVWIEFFDWLVASGNSNKLFFVSTFARMWNFSLVCCWQWAKNWKNKQCNEEFFPWNEFHKNFREIDFTEKFALFLKIFSLTVLLLVLMDPKVVVSIAGEVKVGVPFPKRSTGLNIGIWWVSVQKKKFTLSDWES